MNRLGIALVISAPSGTGKTTLIKRLRKEFPTFGYSVSCTTRAPRDGEVDGRDYHFLSRERFVELRDQGHFAEWAEVHGNFYGTPLPPVREMLAKGQDILFDIDVQGAAQLRKNMPDARFLFILPPSVEELERRLRGRGLDSEEVILRRLVPRCRKRPTMMPSSSMTTWTRLTTTCAPPTWPRPWPPAAAPDWWRP